MRQAPSTSGSSTTDSAASETAPQLAQPMTAQPDTSAPAVPADPSEAERARGTELYKQGDWQVHACILMFMGSWREGALQPQEELCTAGTAGVLCLHLPGINLANSFLHVLQLLQALLTYCWVYLECTLCSRLCMSCSCDIPRPHEVFRRVKWPVGPAM